MATVTLQKSLGAFYTDGSAAKKLVDWAVYDRSSVVLDPSCGDGVFLSAALARLVELGARAPKIYGIDIAVSALRNARQRVQEAELIQQDFFCVTPSEFGHVDTVVGNPPFIRYQTFNGYKESLGHLRAKQAGVDLPRLASSWAPFVVHASQFLRTGGRLAMVMPTELGHAKYAREVLKFLVHNFRHVGVEMYRDKLFENISQGTVLLFCDGYGESSRTFLVASSTNLSGTDREVARADIQSIHDGRFRFNHYLLPKSARELYESLSVHQRVQRLGDVADVGIGYVTGANNFFHLSADEVKRWGVPKRYLRPCVLNLRGMKQVEYSVNDWEKRRDSGEKVYLLALPPTSSKTFPESLQRYLLFGEREGLSDRYKCRVRDSWYSVPHVRIPDAFLSYMSGEKPLLVTNRANLVAPNTMHVLRFLRGAKPLHFALGWQSSLTTLSCELEGHALGGGLFKLEPSEAENVLVVRPRPTSFDPLLSQFKTVVKKSTEKANELVDRLILKRQLGLSSGDCHTLRDAAARIESWRKHKAN